MKRVLVFMLVLSLLVIGGTLVSAEGRSRSIEQGLPNNFAELNNENQNGE